MIKLVAFDWNGTILADTFTIEHTDNKILEHYGLKKITLKQFRNSFQIPISEYWSILGMSPKFFKKHTLEISTLFDSYYLPWAEKCRTRSGTREALIWLKKNKIKAIIYSNHTVEDIEKQLRRLRIDSYVDKILARHQGDHSHMHERSKGGKLAAYVTSHKLKPKEVISVGDTEEEIEIGKRYGFNTVALTGGYHATPRLKKHKPDFLIHNLKQVIAISKRLSQ